MHLVCVLKLQRWPEVNTKETVLRKHIAIAIIENCKHLSEDLTPCGHCIDSAKIALNEDI